MQGRQEQVWAVGIGREGAMAAGEAGAEADHGEKACCAGLVRVCHREGC